jgi:hypothetical protein
MGGSIGDTIAACAALSQMPEPVELYLKRLAPLDWRQSTVKLEGIKALLEIQPYLSKVELSAEVIGKNLDDWRSHWWTGLNLADMVCSWLKLPHKDRSASWLTVPEAKRLAPVVIHRSPRYHNPSFPWRRVVEALGHDLLFIGADHSEYSDFVQRFGLVSFWHCKDYLEAAMIIKDSKLFIGNQSSPQWVCEGLKHPKIIEHVNKGHWAWNCHFERPNCWHVEKASDFPYHLLRDYLDILPNSDQTLSPSPAACG